MSKEHDCVVLTSELLIEGLFPGDVGTVVYIHGDASAYEVEFTTLAGKTIAVATVLSTQCRPIGHRDINPVREIHAEQQGDTYATTEWCLDKLQCDSDGDRRKK